MATTHTLQQFRLPNLVDLSFTLVTMSNDLGAALLFADVMAELRNRVPPSFYAELQDGLRVEKANADADREARTHDGSETAQ